MGDEEVVTFAFFDAADREFITFAGGELVAEAGEGFLGGFDDFRARGIRRGLVHGVAALIALFESFLAGLFSNSFLVCFVQGEDLAVLLVVGDPCGFEVFPSERDRYEQDGDDAEVSDEFRIARGVGCEDLAGSPGHGNVAAGTSAEPLRGRHGGGEGGA